MAANGEYVQAPTAIEMKPVDDYEVEDEAPLNCATFCKNIGTSLKERTAKDWGFSFLKFIGFSASLYFFLFSLDLMGGAFKVLGGCSAGGMFDGVDNPIAGLMIGILATVLVQSSSTSTSIVVALVGAGSMSVQNAIPVIMGANIGTSVTNTIVSMGHATRPAEYKRAFAGATVHDMFNFCAVIVLLPIEWATGMLYHLSLAMTPLEVADDEKWVGPIKILVGPFTKEILSADKKVIKNVALGKYTCAERYSEVLAGTASAGLVKAGAFFKEGATEAEDMATGAVCLVISLVLLCLCLAAMVKLLQSMVMGTSQRMLRKATDLNAYLAMLVGMGITILVQSSSVTTSVLTPLVGVGVLPLEKMFPLTLGANIGTTFTAILASLVSSSPNSVQVALCHLFFNLFGILIWYPIPFMRKVPLNAAKGLGSLTGRFRAFPLVYILFAFALAPAMFLGLSTLFMASAPAYIVLATLLTLVLVALKLRFLWWWNRQDGKGKLYAYLSMRQARKTHYLNAPETMKLLEVRLCQVEKALNLKPVVGTHKAVTLTNSPVIEHGNKVSPEPSGVAPENQKLPSL